MSYTLKISQEQFLLWYGPFFRKGVTIYTSPPEDKEAIKGEPFYSKEVSKESFLFWSAYDRCINFAARKAKKLGAGCVLLRINKKEFGDIRHLYPQARHNPFEADSVTVTIDFYR